MIDSDFCAEDFDKLLSTLCDSGLGNCDAATWLCLNAASCDRTRSCAGVISTIWAFTPPSTT